MHPNKAMTPCKHVNIHSFDSNNARANLNLARS